ncbi:MAG: phage major capsid protein [Clostridia bacterium]|nr:phage major capsid protein [Clostridia bacterium]
MNYKNIVIEKGMYHTPGKSFTQVLEELDPSVNYMGTDMEGMDAFQRQLKRFDIRVSGKDSDRVEKFFSTSQSAALFPEYVARAVRSGMDFSSPLPEIIATNTKIDSMDYRTITSGMGRDDLELRVTEEGEAIPATEIKLSESLVKLKKRGRMLVASYEALRFQKLDLFTVTLRQIGNYIAVSQMKDAVDVLMVGDGNENPIESKAVTGELKYSDLVGLWADLAPYNLNVILAGTDAVTKIMNMPEFRDANAGLDFHGTGRVLTPFGAKLIHVPSMEAGKIIGLDKTAALEMVQAGDVVTEYDKLIDRQLERATISTIAGFAKIYTGAAKMLTYTV